MYNNIMKRVQIYLTELEIKEIKKIIKNNGGGTKSDIIRRAVDEYINKFNIKPLIGNVSTFISPGIPFFAKPLPEKLDVGRSAKVIKDQHPWKGWFGKVTSHYINADDCSGQYGNHMYCIRKDNNENFSVNVQDCEVYE